MSKKKTKQVLDLPKCEVDLESGEVSCKVSADLYEKIRKGVVVKKVSFEVVAEA